jgi:hypothetical protein
MHKDLALRGFSTPQDKVNRDVPMNILLLVVLPSQPTLR